MWNVCVIHKSWLFCDEKERKVARYRYRFAVRHGGHEGSKLIVEGYVYKKQAETRKARAATQQEKLLDFVKEKANGRAIHGQNC